jgi:parallel beta-helix repeat protein
MYFKKSFVYLLICLLTFTSIIGLFAPAKAEVWTDITLPFTITEGGSYRVTAPWMGSGTALSINASNVVVDGQNNLIELTQTEGDYAIVVAPDTSNVVLMNINETSADYGLYAQEGSFTAQSSRFTNNTSAAVFADNATGFEVRDSTLSNNSYGLFTVDSNNFTIYNCHTKNNTQGIETVLSSNITIQSCYLNNNSYALKSENCTNLKISNSTFTENDNAITAEYTTINIDNISVANNQEMAIDFTNSDLTATNFECTNNSIGIYAIYSNFTVTSASLTGNIAAIFSGASNGTVVDSALDNNTFYGVLIFESCSMVINDCSISNSECGMLFEECQNVILENSSVTNNTVGLADISGNNTLVTGNIFSQNAVGNNNIIDSIGGALIAQDTNITVTNNAFNNNHDGLVLGLYDDEQNNTQTYYYNTFNNNSFTLDFDYALPSNFTNQQIYFYNNFVNDTAYVNPTSFTEEYQYMPTEATFHLNTTLQPGERVNLDGGRMIGGNYWAYPNGTGPSQTGTDANNDGFLDAPFDLFGNGTIYDYLPYSSNFVEHVESLTISPQAATITAGTAIIFQTTATDQYGNNWNASATYNVNEVQITGNTITPTVAGVYYIQTTYNGNLTETTLTVTPDAVNYFIVETSNNATTGTPFSITVGAIDAYRNIAVDFAGTVTVSANGSSTTSKSGAFTDGIWTGEVVINEAGKYTITVTDGNGHTGTSRVITVNSAVSPTPNPTATTSTVQATKEDQSKVTLTLNGNITASQMTNVLITTNQTASITTISFTVTGPSGTSGFSNITIAKTAIPYGTLPTVYIDGQQAQNQGHTEDSQNFYVWYTTRFSTHQIEIQFNGNAPAPTQSQTTILEYALIVVAVAAAVMAVAVVLVASKRKQ